MITYPNVFSETTRFLADNLQSANHRCIYMITMKTTHRIRPGPQNQPIPTLISPQERPERSRLLNKKGHIRETGTRRLQATPRFMKPLISVSEKWVWRERFKRC